MVSLNGPVPESPSDFGTGPKIIEDQAYFQFAGSSPEPARAGAVTGRFECRATPAFHRGFGLAATRTINLMVFIYAIRKNHRLSRCLRALRPGVCSDGVGAKPNGASILTLRFLAQVRSLRGIGYLQPGSSAERHRASREEASGPPANTET